MQSVKLTESYQRSSYLLGGADTIDSYVGSRRYKKKLPDKDNAVLRESQNLRDELLRTTARLEAFSAKLVEEASKLESASQMGEGEDTERRST